MSAAVKDPNAHELTARALKVSKLIDAIDRAFDQVLPSPPEVRARCILLCMPEWGMACWAYLCADAGVKAPSEKTIALIRSVYERRANNRTD